MVQQSGMSEDCALHMQMTSPSKGGDASGNVQHTGCQSCDICMPLAALEDGTVITLAPMAHAVPMRHPGTFESAEPARYAKPPIS